MDRFLIFIGLSFTVSFAPGPSILFAVSQGLKNNFWASIPGLMGNLSASIGYGILSAIGLGYFLQLYPFIGRMIAYLGAAYLIISGVFLIAMKKDETKRSLQGKRDSTSYWKNFLDGLITSVANPKIALFYLLIIPQFIRPGGSVGWQIGALAVLQNMMKFCSLLFYSVLANKITSFMANGKHMFINYICGILIIFSGITLLIENF